MSSFDPDLSACRARQRRLLAALAPLELDLLIVTQIEHVQWLAGPRFQWYFQPAASLDAHGRLTLVAPQKWKGDAAADDVLRYDAQWHSTLRNDQRQASTVVLLSALAERPRSRRVGVEFSTFGRHVRFPDDVQLVDIEPELYVQRRRKDPDELLRIRQAIAATGRMYERARQIIRPGIREIEVFNALQAAAVEQCDEMLTGTGNDYQCGSRGGPPRGGRLAEAGELYILDLGPAFRGYFADNCRTIAVSDVSSVQREAWHWIMRAFEHVERTVRPGKNARELFHEIQTLLDQAPIGVFNHHLGHGIGLFPHEAPHLNPQWDDTFQVGDVFTAEPGLYAPELRTGMRIENDYLVTESGVECLSNFPLTLD